MVGLGLREGKIYKVTKPREQKTRDLIYSRCTKNDDEREYTR